MKKIALTKGHYALVDDEDFEWLNQWKWTSCSTGQRVIAVRATSRKDGRKTICMHRLIMGVTGRWPVVDHINGNPLDNRRCNLRLANQSQNMRNRKAPTQNTSGYKGVQKNGNGWMARITINYKAVCLGTFETKEAAAKAYNEAAIKLHGDFAYLNKV